MTRLSLAFIFLAGVHSVPAQAETVSIVCEGVANTTEAVGFNGNNQIVTAPRTNGASVIFKLLDGKAQIKLPSTLWRSKGDGWFPVTDLEVGNDAIKGRVPLSSFTKPHLHIDRLNGRIDLSSSSYVGSSFTFSGACTPLDETARKF